MKPNRQKAMSSILSDVVYCICIYCGQSPEIGLKIFTIIFVYCISVVLKTLQIQHKIVNAMKLCPSVIKSTTVNMHL